MDETNRDGLNDLLAEPVALAPELFAPILTADIPAEERLRTVLKVFPDAIARTFTGTLAEVVASELPAEAADWLDRVLAEVRRRAAADGCTVLPSAWRYAVPLLVTDLGEAAAVAVFRPEVPRGVVFRLRSFGWARGAEVLEPARVSVSAGPAPQGLRELEDLLRAHGATELLDRLRGWRDAALHEALDVAAVQFFVDFWDNHADPAIANALTVVLVQGLELTPFSPHTFQEYPHGWAQATDGSRLVTGQVRKVVRPGLTDRDGGLRVAARVEVD